MQNHYKRFTSEMQCFHWKNLNHMPNQHEPSSTVPTPPHKICYQKASQFITSEVIYITSKPTMYDPVGHLV